MGTQLLEADRTRRILDDLRRLVKFLRVSARAAERDLGISGAQLFVLQTLEQADGPLSVNELAERTRTHQSSVSVVVQKLVSRKLVRRVTSGADARRLELTLSPAAATLLKKSPDSAQTRLIEALDRMPAADVKNLARLMAQLCDGLGIEGEAPSMLFEDEGARKPTRKRGG